MLEFGVVLASETESASGLSGGLARAQVAWAMQDYTFTYPGLLVNVQHPPGGWYSRLYTDVL